MREALHVALTLFCGYCIGALHVWFWAKTAEGRAYFKGYDEGYRNGRSLARWEHEKEASK